ncbi:MAG TPA: hypothetical protein VLZ78_12165, partial [Terrimesophilobacter sp.]|nr:hypothetical protein [Terrimesophilobacter sp.]
MKLIVGRVVGGKVVQLRAHAPELFLCAFCLWSLTRRSAMANKEASVAELTEKFRSSNAVLLTEYRG